jgi:hypothetical protein
MSKKLKHLEPNMIEAVPKDSFFFFLILSQLFFFEGLKDHLFFRCFKHGTN